MAMVIDPVSDRKLSLYVLPCREIPCIYSRRYSGSEKLLARVAGTELCNGALVCKLGRTHMSIQRKPHSAEPVLYALRLDAENLEVIHGPDPGATFCHLYWV